MAFLWNLLLTQALAVFPTDAELQCSVCQILTKKMNTEINDVDEKANLLVGGRIEGPSKRKTVKWARSETRLSGILDEICEKLGGYNAVALRGDQWKFIVKTEDTRTFDEEVKRVREEKAAKEAAAKADTTEMDGGGEKKKEEEEEEKKEEKEVEEEKKKDKDKDGSPTTPTPPTTTPPPPTTTTPPPVDEKESGKKKRLFNKIFQTGKEGSQLKKGCYRFLNDYEERMIDMLRDNYDPNFNLNQKLCFEVSKKCAKKVKKEFEMKSKGEENEKGEDVKEKTEL